jgi:predicted protein tyrosine phosphatase
VSGAFIGVSSKFVITKSVDACSAGVKLWRLQVRFPLAKAVIQPERTAMPSIHVCSLARLPSTVETLAASHVLTLISPGTDVPTPPSIADGRHRYIPVHDIWEPLEGHILPDETHVAEVIAFARSWDRARPMVVHCFAGISRSTAAAMISTLLVRPDLDPHDLARRVREASPTATPNPEIIRLGDQALGFDGRLIRAVQSIGRGEDAYEGVPFSIPIA